MAVTKLRRIRREHGFTSAEALGKACGLTKMCVTYWELGHSKPRSYNAERVAAVLRTPASTLFEPENESGASNGC